MTTELTSKQGHPGLVVRSEVPPDKPYSEYRPWLRNDFFYSCGYCTMSEAEAQALRFTIDTMSPKMRVPI
jgi:hypothetical protein